MIFKNLIISFVALIAVNAEAQNNCFSENPYPSKEVFKRTEVEAQYKGEIGLSHFLSTKINFLNLASGQIDKFYSDTAQVKFILSSNGTMSDLSVDKTKNELFKTNLLRVVKQSACYWKPGIISGRELSSWVIINIFYTIERKSQTISLNVGYEIMNKGFGHIDSTH